MVFRHLNLLETAYFGLRYLDQDGQTVSDLHKAKSDDHLCLICMCTALVRSCEKTQQTAQGRRAVYALLWCKVLRCRSLQAPRGNHKVKPRALPPVKAVHRRVSGALGRLAARYANADLGPFV